MIGFTKTQRVSADIVTHFVASRRRSLLTGSAFTGGIFALMLAANPQSAVAACTVTALPNTVSCDSTTTTDDSNNVVGTNSDREQLFGNGGSVTPGASGSTVNAGATIDGYGLAVTNTSSGAGVSVNNSGTITLTSGIPSAGGTSALNINAAGGLITYTGNGSVNDGSEGTTAFTITNTGAGGVNFGTSGTPITPNYSGTNGLSVSTVDGDQNLFLDNGTVFATAANGNPINLSSSTGTINLTTTDGNELRTTATDNTVTGIRAVDGTGNINISSASVMGSTANAFETGIEAITAGDVNVHQTGGAINISSTSAGPGTGIDAQSSKNGNVTVTTDAGSAINVAAGGTELTTGIFAHSLTGSVNVTVNGNIDPPVIGVDVDAGGNATITQNTNLLVNSTPGNASIGLEATSNVAGNVLITGTGSVTANGGGGTNATGAIEATNTGTNGNVTVSGSGNTSSDTGFGIQALISNTANNGSVSVNRSGTVNAGLSGIIAATNGGGDVTVQTGAAVTAGATGVGIGAVQEDGNGNVSVTTGGAVTGGLGIGAGAHGNGAVTIDSSAGLVTGDGTGPVSVTLFGQTLSLPPDGILGLSQNGAINITTGAVSSASGNGIEAETGLGTPIFTTAATGNGAITIVTKGAVNGATGNIATTQYGILAVQNQPSVASGNISITTGGTVIAGTGIEAIGQDNANIVINSSTAQVTGNGVPIFGSAGAGDGIYAQSLNGSVSITTAAVTSTFANGIEVQTGLGTGAAKSGAITIVTMGDVTGEATHTGILAVQNFAGTTNGDISITTGGAVNAGTGVSATALGNASITITTTAGLVTGTDTAGTVGTGVGDGVFASAANGNVSVTTGPVIGAANGIEVQTGEGVTPTRSGAIKIVTQDDVTGGATGTGILAVQNFAGTTNGDISITTGGAVNAGTGISATALGSAAVTIDSTAGLVRGTAASGGAIGVGDGVFAGTQNGAISITTAAVTSTNVDGILARTTGTAGTGTNGAITIVTKGNVSGGATFVGILADQMTAGITSGDISITTGGTVSAGTGIVAAAQSGADITIDASAGLVTGTAAAGAAGVGDGVAVAAVNGSVDITTAAVTSTHANGIEVQAGTGATATRSGAITILTQGDVTGGATGTAILAVQNFAGATNGAISITTGGATSAGTGISATALDNAAITLTTTAGLVSGTGAAGTANSGIGDGIFAQSVNGFVSITTGAVSSTNGNGIEAQTGTGPTPTKSGAIIIVAHGDVTGGTTGTAILAIQRFASATNGDVSITTGGATSAGTGISATGVGSAAVTINSTAGKVTGDGNAGGAGVGDGVYAQTDQGAISITTAAVFSASANGIEAGTINGAITIVTHGDVSANAGAAFTGILAGQIAGIGTAGDISITTGGTVSAGAGITATAVLGADITIDTTAGLVTGVAANGINANGVSGTVIVDTVAVTATAGATTAINATTSGGGAVTVHVASGFAITGGATGIGINATQAGGDGDVSVTTGAAVTAGIGINASANGTGAVTVVSTAGLVTGSNADGVSANSGSGAVSLNTAAVTGATNGIEVQTNTGAVTVTTHGNVNGDQTTAGHTGILVAQSATGANGDISIAPGGTVTAATGISATGLGEANVTVTTLAGVTGNVTGANGSGIVVASVDGAITLNANAQQITGTGAGNSALSATSNGIGAATVNVSTTTTARGNGAIGVTLDTSLGSGNGFLNNSGKVIGAGTATVPVVMLGNNNIGVVTLNNFGGALIANSLLPSASVSALAIGTLSPTALGATDIENSGTLIGRIALSGGVNIFEIQGNGVWAVSDSGTGAADAANFGSGTGANTLNNFSADSIWISGPTATISGLQDINNFGTMHIGNTPCSTAATQTATCGINFNATAGAAQLVTNGSLMEVNGHATFNSTGTGSSFVNEAGGVIDMSLFQTGTLRSVDQPPLGTPAFPASTHVTTDYLALNATTTGTSDLNYTYTFGTPYSWTGSGGNTIYLDTNVGAPGAASDRLIISGATSGQTGIQIWDTNTTPGGAFNPVGITLAAVNGASLNAFVLAGQINPAHNVPGANFDEYEAPGAMGGSLGAIKKGFFTDFLLQAPLQGAGAGSVNAGATRYALFGLPSIEAPQLPIITTAAQTIFNTTALDWIDRQDELRNWMRWGQCRQSQAYGGGADLALKAATCPDGGPGIWMKTIGSSLDRTASQNPGDLLGFNTGLPAYDLSYKQNTFATYGGIDFGKEEVFRPYDSWVTSIMAGYIDSNLNFKASPTSYKFTGGTVGISGTYLNGGFFADGLVKSDILELHSNFPSLASFGITVPEQQVLNIGGVFNIGYRFDITRLFYVEPIGTLSYVSTHVKNFSAPGLDVNFGNGDNLRAAVGTRVGVNWLSTATYEADTSLTGKVWDQFWVRNGVTLTDTNADPNATPLTLTDKVSRVYGDLTFNANIINKGSGWSVFANGGMQFGEQFTSLTGKTGVRFQW